MNSPIRFTLSIVAVIVFIVGLFDLPNFGTARCIALGLALLTLAQLIP